jgi:hypothetical protein
VKGLNWFDLEWYIRKGIPLHLQHLALRAHDSSDWPSEQMSIGELMDMLHKMIDAVDFSSIRQDVLPFIPDTSVMDIW